MIRRHTLGPTRLIRWGSFGAWTVRLGRHEFEIFRASTGRRFPNGRRWMVRRSV